MNQKSFLIGYYLIKNFIKIKGAKIKKEYIEMLNH